MQGAENLKSSILEDLNDKVKLLDLNGGAFAKVTREKVDNIKECHDTLQHQFMVFMENMGKIQTSILILTLVTTCLAIMAGGTLVWNIIKAVTHF